MYDDIIYTKYPFPLKHTRMSNYDRCKEFMPFSALTGYSDAVREVARVTDDEIFLDEEKKEILNMKLNRLIDVVSTKPSVDITYFVRDVNKDGGKYLSVSGNVNKIDLYKGIIFIDDYRISINSIVDISSEILDI